MSLGGFVIKVFRMYCARANFYSGVKVSNATIALPGTPSDKVLNISEIFEPFTHPDEFVKFLGLGFNEAPATASPLRQLHGMICMSYKTKPSL